MHLQNGTENALERGVLKKRSTKNYARGAISILKHPFARVRKGAFEKKLRKTTRERPFRFYFPFPRTHERGFYYRVKMCADIDAKWLILLSWRK